MAALLLAGSTSCRPRSSQQQRDDLRPLAETPPRTNIPDLAVLRAEDGAFVIDGVLNEPDWQRAERTDLFVAPGDGAYSPGSPVNARGRALWSQQFLYLAIEVADAEPSSPFAVTDVDPHIWSSASGVELMLQPGDPGTNANYYEVQVDVNGAVWDTRFDDYNRPIDGEGDARTFGHQSWDAGIERRVTINESLRRYTVELRIPWRSFASPSSAVPPAGGDVWRANLYSFRDGQRHALAWSPLLGGGNFHYAPRFGRFRFVDAVE